MGDRNPCKCEVVILSVKWSLSWFDISRTASVTKVHWIYVSLDLMCSSISIAESYACCRGRQVEPQGWSLTRALKDGIC